MPFLMAAAPWSQPQALRAQFLTVCTFQPFGPQYMQIFIFLLFPILTLSYSSSFSFPFVSLPFLKHFPVVLWVVINAFWGLGA